MNPNSERSPSIAPRKPRSDNENTIEHVDASTRRVILQDGAGVLVDADALQDLEQRGIVARWRCYDNGTGRRYVAVTLPAHLGGASTTVAGLIAKREPGEGISYANGDRFDLRRRNLVLMPRGRGRMKAAEAHAAMLFPRDLEARAQWLQAFNARIERGTRAMQRRALMTKPDRKAVQPVSRQPAGSQGLAGSMASSCIARVRSNCPATQRVVSGRVDRSTARRSA